MANRDEIVTVRESVILNIDGHPTALNPNRDLFHKDHVTVRTYPHLFKPVHVQYDVEEASAEPGRKRQR